MYVCKPDSSFVVYDVSNVEDIDSVYYRQMEGETEKLYVCKYDGTYDVYDASEVDSVVFQRPVFPLCPNDNHPHAIDLGLPNGMKWACCNVGATCPEDVGNYYAWGETETKEEITRDNYKFLTGTHKEYKENVGNIIYHDFKNIGEDISGTEYDVAHVKWGVNWYMPSKNEWESLDYSNMYSITANTTYNGVKGTMIEGKNGRRLFFPYGGYKIDSDTKGDTDGPCWTSTLCSTNNESGEMAYSNGTNKMGLYRLHQTRNRYFGLPVRAIYK